MAIIKNGRINIWNAVKKQFETVHPETETARITDFADGIVQKLALTSAMTAVTALQPDSWFGKLLKMALTASGVRYNIADKGYICFGSFLGGLIIQWGNFEGDGTQTQTFPITFSKIFNLQLWQYDGVQFQYSGATNNTTFTVNSVTHNSSIGYTRYWLAIGY